MTYEKTNWKVGDTITAEKLNNIEGGIKANETAISSIDTSGGGSGDFVITATGTGSTLTADKTYSETLEAFNNGAIPVLRINIPNTNNYKYYPMVSFVNNAFGFSKSSYTMEDNGEGDLIVPVLGTESCLFSAGTTVTYNYLSKILN